jgi:uncharacterized protein
MPGYGATVTAVDIDVEEVRLLDHSIEGVLTSTCAFVGPTHTGPEGVVSQLITSVADFERTYGGLDKLGFTGDRKAVHRRNYMAHAVRAYFTNGGKRLYVVRVMTGFGGGSGNLFSGGTAKTLPAAAKFAADYASALDCLDALEEVSVVAAPGYSALADMAGGSIYHAIQDALLTHVADPLRYRMAVLDAPPGATPQQMRDLRSNISSAHAALYYPWVVTAHPQAGRTRLLPSEVTLPPSGFVCGLYARNDAQRGVYKSPANLVVRGALRFERNLGAGEQETLNPIGVNCLVALPGRGLCVWGARTISNDPEWHYVSGRRYFNFLGASITRGTMWAVFEPNGERLWAKVRDTIANFLNNQWHTGALPGNKQDLAYFVRCDRTTMTQDDINNGRLVCLIGVAPVRPAEFVILRIGLWTADHRP